MKFLALVVLVGALLAARSAFGAHDTDWDTECRAEARRTALRARECARDAQKEAARARREAERAARELRKEVADERRELQREQMRARREIMDEVRHELHRAWLD